MSRYENYSATSAVYDETRVVVGLEFISAGLQSSAVALESMVVLDAGCGTGSYAAAIADRVARVVGVDLNDGMLKVAADKLARHVREGRAALQRANLTDLPFADASFDGVMVNQVLHHLDAGDDFTEHARAVFEIARVLRPGGVLVLNTSSREQIRDAFWPSALIAEAGARMAAAFMPVADLVALLESASLDVRHRHLLTDEQMQGPNSTDPRQALNAAFRRGDSFWAKVTDRELRAALSAIRAMDADGTIDEFAEESERRRRQLGQATFLVAARV